VSITQKLKDLFQEQGIASDRILVAADGVDLERFNVRETQEECRNKLGLPIDKKIVLYTGHLYDWKGTQVLAQASDLLPAEIYFVGGTKEDVQDFKVKDPNLKIKIIGHRPYSEIPCWLRAADVLVLPNSGKEEISKHWTSPLKLFEYMAASKPIVASDLPSIREILNKDNAILVAPDNPEALAEGINKALTDKGLSARISVLAYEGVKNYTWQKRAEKVLKFILEK
jgi:glycosyltransferase involved in cell wall biosynthesis